MKKPKTASKFTACALTGILGGCAGPTTPLGAIWAITPQKSSSAATRAEHAERTPASSKAPSIRFSPDQQVLHGPSHMKLIVENIHNNTSEYDLTVLYNGFDVTTSFLRQAKISEESSKGKILIDVPSIRLSPSSDHVIEVIYEDPAGRAYARLAPPTCYALRPAPVRNVAGFKPQPEVLRTISDASAHAGFNPAFFSGLVAQESGFNPRVVSWAHAMGLTQITPIAESELMDRYRERYQDWPRYPGINGLPVPVLKAMVFREKINASNEWRLDPERSIRGGIEYIQLLTDRWSTPENTARISRLSGDPEVTQTRLILASYHSGYSRVLSAVQDRGKNWIRARDLKEARKYVNRIMSYCSVFSKGETHENAP